MEQPRTRYDVTKNKSSLYPQHIKCLSCHHVETSQLICSAIDWFLYDSNFGV